MDKTIEEPFFESFADYWTIGEKILKWKYKGRGDMPKWEVKNQHVFATNLGLLSKEIADNLDECKAADEWSLERYTFSLLRPFKEYSNILHHDNLRLAGEVGYKYWAAFDNWAFSEIQSPPVLKEQMEAEQYNERKYHDCVVTLGNLMSVAYEYANMLDAVLLERGIDLLSVQSRCGITLLMSRDLSELQYWLGTWERATELIEKVSPQKEPQSDNVILPEELNTDKAKELLYSLCRAGYAKIEGGKYIWNGTQQLCAYFAERASHYLKLSNKMDANGNITTKWRPFEILFGFTDRTLHIAKQNWMRLNTKFEPTGFEGIARLFE